MANSDTRTPKHTRKWVLIADRIADRVISIGGVLVIGAVLGMMVFLVYEVIPLFKGAKADSRTDYAVQSTDGPILGLGVDEYKTIAAAIHQDGSVNVWHAQSGFPLTPQSFDLKGKTVTAFSKAMDNCNVAFGFSDGTVRFGKITFKSDVLPADDEPKDLKKIDETDSTDGSAIFSRIPGKQIRKVSVGIELDDEVKVSEAGDAIVALDYRYTQFGERPKKTFATVDASGRATVSVAESKLNLFTRKSVTTVSKSILPPVPLDPPIKYAVVNNTGEEVYFAAQDSTIYRYNVRDFQKPFLAETKKMLPQGVELTTLGFLSGERSLVAGGSDGSLSIFFLLRPEKSPTEDGYQLVKARQFEPQPAAVTTFVPAMTGKTFVTGDAKGNLWLRYGTSASTLLKLKVPEQTPKNEAVTLAPRLDAIVAVVNGSAGAMWGLNVRHPETSWSTLFGKVWYEGYPEPTYTWQSTGATDDFEPKLSLVPLIFGTIKATFYSLLFAIPIALLGAIYTSEFLPHKARNKVKPVMEVMASIPSVVLGFVAALVLAPIVESWIAALILAFVVVPLSFIASAFLWQMLPPTMAVRFQGMPKFAFMFVVMGVSLYTSYQAGPLFEKLFFDGNFISWVNGSIGRPAPFLFLMNLPVMAILVSWVMARLYGYRFHSYLRTVRMPYSALLDLVRWLGITALTVILSYALALILQYAGFDPRGSFVGTYVQRNTLIVGFAMGFAVIPIIYTLAEDALNSVPDHLRSASLGCGATPWQTAKWVILPTAVSGVFSAIMIGMGRAVGETMIVVMSAGNTPVIDWNILNGLRALSANIAVELPEAPKDATLYRVLFLTGLVLFSMTFVINTVAELVRIHFRKRATQL
jgi:phosphate transport system permease protein